MLYSVSVEHINKETVIEFKKRDQILKSEIVFGVNSFFELIFFLSKNENIFFKTRAQKYPKSFMRYSSALEYYDSILDFIKDNKHCEIV